MEKPKKNNTITIKIDGKSRTYQENKNIEKHENVISSKSFVEDDKKKLKFNKQLKDQSIFQSNESETAAATDRKEEEPFDWILPESTISDVEPEEYTIASYSKPSKKGSGILNTLKKNKNGLFPSLFFALLFAVLIGMSFGLIMLKLVINDQGIEAGGVIQTEKPKENIEETVVENYTPPTITAMVVQEGAYTSIESANKSKDALNQKEIPSAIVTTDRSYLFVGVGETKDQGKIIGDKLVSKGIKNIYPKEVQLGGSPMAQITTSEQKILELATQLYIPLVSISSNLTIGQPIREESSKKIIELKKEWDKIKADSLKNESIISIKQEVDKAMAIAISPSSEKSSELQQNLLNFLSIYQSKK